MLIQRLSLIRQTRANQLEGVTSCKAISSSTPRSMPVFNSFVAQQGALGGGYALQAMGIILCTYIVHCNMTDQLSNKVEINTFIVSAFYPEVSHYTYEAGCLEFQKSS